VQAAAIEASYTGHVETREPEILRGRALEADAHRATPQAQDLQLLEDAWFSRGETELAVQIVSLDRDPTADAYLPEVRSYRTPIAVAMMLASALTWLLIQGLISSNFKYL
jgi:hypothetical protein